jgi:hypothetical protein
VKPARGIVPAARRTCSAHVATAAEARSRLRRARLAEGDRATGRLLAAHDRLYPARIEPQPPPGRRAGRAGGVLPPLTPDRFAEDFIAVHLRQPRAAGLLAELLSDGKTEPSAARRARRRSRPPPQLALPPAGPGRDQRAALDPAWEAVGIRRAGGHGGINLYWSTAPRAVDLHTRPVRHEDRVPALDAHRAIWPAPDPTGAAATRRFDALTTTLFCGKQS